MAEVLDIHAPSLGLPPTWHTVDVGARSGVTLAARRPVAGASFTPNLALAVAVEPAFLPVGTLADRELGRLAGSVSRARLVNQRSWGEGPTAGIARNVRVLTRPTRDERARQVLQCLVHLGGEVEPGAREHLVALLALSCEPAQLPLVGAEFEAIINSLRLPSGEPRRGEGAAWTST